MAAMSLVPSLAECGIKQMVHGPDTHSVDHEPLLGRAPQTDNLWYVTALYMHLIYTREPASQPQPAVPATASGASLPDSHSHSQQRQSISFVHSSCLIILSSPLLFPFPTHRFKPQPHSLITPL